MMEQWKQVIIDGVEYDYSVSTYGRVRNDKTGQFLKPYVIKDGYLQVGLYKDKKTKQLQVHRLVAIMFIPNDSPTIKTIVHHIDHNVQNNHVENLQWTTNQYNVEEGRGKRVRCVETGVIYNSYAHASRETGICDVCIYLCCSGKHKTCGKQKLHFEYVE